MENMPFSVLMPVYFKENPEYLHSAINSLLHQTLLPSEIVIVEDGPLTDALYEVIQEFKNNHQDLFTIIRLPKNGGMGVAMDTGLKQCKYSWVARMDSDDLSRHDRFEKQVKYLQSHPGIDALGGWIEEFRHNTGDLKQVRHLPLTHDDIKHFAKTRNPINHMTVMFHKDKAIKAGGYWHFRVLEDYHLWYKMLLQGCNFSNLPDILVDARVGNNMLGRRKGIPYLKREIAFFKEMYSSGFISEYQFCKAVIGRAIMKIIPLRILERLYTLILRSKK